MSFDGVAFGHRVKAARVWARIEPKELALRLGMSDEAVYQIERGERLRPPSRPVMQALARELGQPEDWFLAGDDPPWTTSLAAGAESLDDLRRQALAEAARLLQAAIEADERLRAEAQSQAAPARRARTG